MGDQPDDQALLMAKVEYCLYQTLKIRQRQHVVAAIKKASESHSQTAIADYLGVSQTWISKLLRT